LQIVHRYAVRECRDEDMAAEVVLYTFELLRKRRDDSDAGELSLAWVLTVARNKIRESRRRRRRYTWLERAISTVWPHGLPEDTHPFETSNSPQPAESVVEAEATLHLHQAIDGLPEDQREAILLRYFVQLSISEVAEVMRRSVKSVDGLLARGRRALYGLTRDYFEEDTNGGPQG
jgi:RNA polymerase sigma-70 factor (ECF subfamily)